MGYTAGPTTSGTPAAAYFGHRFQKPMCKAPTTFHAYNHGNGAIDSGYVFINGGTGSSSALTSYNITEKSIGSMNVNITSSTIVQVFCDWTADTGF